VRAGRLGAARIKRERMLFQSKSLGFGHGRLALFNLGIVELLHPAAIEADQMVVMRAFIELINGFAAFKIAARDQASLLKLCEHAINGGQANIRALVEQDAIHVFRRHVALRARLKNLHDFQARQGGLQAGVFQFVKRGHGSGCQLGEWGD
jgi:hypothetical protein